MLLFPISQNLTYEILSPNYNPTDRELYYLYQLIMNCFDENEPFALNLPKEPNDLLFYLETTLNDERKRIDFEVFRAKYDLKTGVINSNPTKMTNFSIKYNKDEPCMTHEVWKEYQTLIKEIVKKVYPYNQS